MTEGVAERRALKDQVLEAALQHVPFDGWSKRTLVNAAADAGIDVAEAARLFPAAGDSLLEWLDDWADRQMLTALAGSELSALPVRRRVAKLVRARFEALASHREAVRRALATRSLPQNLGAATRALWRTVDLVWDAAGMPGSTADGWAWYTRRASLAGVLATTTLFWLEDRSDDQSDSWAFLDRRIDDVLKIGQARARVEEMFRVIPGFRPSTRRQ